MDIETLFNFHAQVIEGNKVVVFLTDPSGTSRIGAKRIDPWDEADALAFATATVKDAIENMGV